MVALERNIEGNTPAMNPQPLPRPIAATQCTMLIAMAGVIEDVVCSFPGMNRVPKRTPMFGVQLYSIAGANANE
jgi:hypothetical protein